MWSIWAIIIASFHNDSYLRFLQNNNYDSYVYMQELKVVHGNLNIIRRFFNLANLTVDRQIYNRQIYKFIYIYFMHRQNYFTLASLLDGFYQL